MSVGAYSPCGPVACMDQGSEVNKAPHRETPLNAQEKGSKRLIHLHVSNLDPLHSHLRLVCQSVTKKRELKGHVAARRGHRLPGSGRRKTAVRHLLFTCASHATSCPSSQTLGMWGREAPPSSWQPEQANVKTLEPFNWGIV